MDGSLSGRKGGTDQLREFFRLRALALSGISETLFSFGEGKGVEAIKSKAF
jgi:hypothetical protein